MADLGQLIEVLNCSLVARCRDECGDLRIVGKNGWIYAQPEGFYIWYNAGSPRTYGFGKKELSFCKVTQDGDEEGVLLLDRLPTAAEAWIIMNRMGIRRRKHLSEAALANLAKARLKSPVQGLRPPKTGEAV